MLPAELPPSCSHRCSDHGTEVQAGATIAVADAPVSGTVVCSDQQPFLSGCIELATGQCRRTEPRLLGAESALCLAAAGIVNSSLPQFVECVRSRKRVSVLQPRPDLSEREAGGIESCRTLAAVDPPALELDQFWSTFIDDLVIGDFRRKTLSEGD